MNLCTFSTAPVRLLNRPSRGVLIVALGAFAWLSPVFAASTVPDLPAEFDLNTQAQSTSGHGKIRISFDQQSSGGYVLEEAPEGLTLFRRTHAGETRLASSPAGGLASATASPLKLTIKRRAGHISVLAGSRLALNVEDSTFNEGSASLAASGGATASSLRLQPLDALYFSDDFMRQPDEPGEWDYVTGKWQIQTVGNVQRGANPFSLESRPGPSALATTGYSFWGDYSFEAAVRGAENTRFGICVNLQDDKNYDMLTWSPGPKGSLHLDRIVDGKSTTLAEKAGGFIPDEWYSLGLRTYGGRLVAEIDHHPVLSAEDTTFGQGKIGLYTEGSADSVVYFDSILVHPAHFIYDDFAPKSVHHWQLQDDKALAGDPAWKNYTITADVVGSRESMGVPFHYQNSQNYDVFSWNSTGSRLIAVANGRYRVMGESSRGVPVGETHTVQVGGEDGYVWAAIDGKKVVEGLDLAVTSGRPGFQPPALAGKSFRSVGVSLMEPPEPTDALSAEFTNVDHHKEMAGWAGPLNAWEPADFGKDAGYWHKGDLFGNIAVKVPLIPQDLQSGEFAVILNGNGKSADSGYQLEYAATPNGGITLTLLREGEKVASGHLKPPADTQDQITLDVYRQGRFIYAGIGRDMPLRYEDSTPVDGYTLLQPVGYAPDRSGHSRLGLVIRGSTPLDIPDIVVNNRHVYAETFHLAPVNWRPQGGTWEVTRRWACQPGWTWYGGKREGSYAANWYKRPILGDQSIDYYTGAMMAAVQDSGTEAWRDLNCSFCGDGVNLFSGYTLVVEGWNGTTTRLFRKGRQVAESSAFSFPPQGTAHRLWFDVHIQKTGPNIRVVVSYVSEDGEEHVTPLIKWTDPAPLGGGFVGFWTYDNGMMLARAVLSYQEEGVTPLYTAEPVWLAQEPDGATYPKSPDAGLASIINVHPDYLLSALSQSGPTPQGQLAIPAVFPAPEAKSAPEKPHAASHPSRAKSAEKPAAKTRAHERIAAKPAAKLAAHEETTAKTRAHEKAETLASATAKPASVQKPTVIAKKETPAAGPVIDPAPGLVGRRDQTDAVVQTVADTVVPTPGSAPTAAAPPATAGSVAAPVQVKAHDVAFSVQPGGTLTDIQYKGRNLIQQVTLDIRSSEWHQLKLTPENTKVSVVQGDDPGVVVAFDVRSPDTGIKLTGRERVSILPDGVLRVQASVDPTTAFSSKRISLNLSVNSDDYTGQQFQLNTGGAIRTVAASAQPLFPIQIATQINRLFLPNTGIEIRPLGGTGAFEDLRHFGLDQYWYEQAADYTYPKVEKGARRYFGLDIHFHTPEIPTQQ